MNQPDNRKQTQNQQQKHVHHMSHPKGKLNTREKLKYFMLLILLVVMLNFLKLKMKSDVQLRQPRLTALIMMKQQSGLFKTLQK